MAGKLTRVMAVGTETTGWAIEPDEPKPIDGKSAKSIEFSYPKTKKLEKLENKHVVATGTLTHRVVWRLATGRAGCFLPEEVR